MKREIALILLAPLFILLAVVKPMAGTLPTPTVTDLYNFTDGNDAYYPYSGLLVGADGNLYGTTIRGGTGEYGTVFELSHSNGGWTETVLYNFTANGDGGEPMATLVADAAGNLYGTTLTGGTITNVCHTGCGVVFELIRGSSGWTENTLYSFAGRPDGEYPESSVAFDSAGDIFGTTTGGGTDESYGIVFELMPSGGNWTEKILHTFTAGNDGAFPAAGVILDKKGDLYGTTVGSGTGQGTVYEMVRSGAGTWSERVLYAFTGGNDGGGPWDQLVWDAAGNLYGTTYQGGGITALCSFGCGTVFELSPSGRGWAENLLYKFSAGADGLAPTAGVIFDAKGHLYGTTTGGGPDNAGTVYRLTHTAQGWTENTVSFNGANGNTAYASVAFLRGDLVGTTQYGGTSNRGVVYRVAP